TNFDSFKRHLNDVYGVETKLRGKTLSFKHPERERFIRANKLGADYEREGLEHVFARQIEREQEHERAISRNEGTQRTDEKLYQSSHERGMAKEDTIHNQVNQIQEKSDKVMSNMQSILNTQGKMLEENAENLQAILINGHEEMEKSNNKTVKAVQEMQKSN